MFYDNGGLSRNWPAYGGVFIFGRLQCARPLGDELLRTERNNYAQLPALVGHNVLLIR